MADRDYEESRDNPYKSPGTPCSDRSSWSRTLCLGLLLVLGILLSWAAVSALVDGQIGASMAVILGVPIVGGAVYLDWRFSIRLSLGVVVLVFVAIIVMGLVVGLLFPAVK